MTSARRSEEDFRSDDFGVPLVEERFPWDNVEPT